VQKAVVGLDIRRDDLEDVVGFAGRAVALGDFRAGGDFPFELLDPAFGMAREMDMGEGADVQTQLFAVDVSFFVCTCRKRPPPSA
jgi:hypothetical protein